METIISKIKDYAYYLSLPKVTLTDLLEIFIIAFVIYHTILWVKNTRAWTLVKGILVLFLCYLIAYILDMSVILWIFNKTLAIGITALLIVFQPELRKALEEIGKKNIVKSIIPFDDQKDKNKRFSDKSINEIVKATVELAKAKTGALIIMEKDIILSEYERTGINLDSAISSQLLINIFEHNTPLHDGAVIIRGDRIVAATCYLPLSDNLGLSKELGTRHRAGVGISEVSDSLTIIVSEETGKISVAIGGKLLRNIDGDLLKKKLMEMQGNVDDDKKKKRFNFTLHLKKDSENK
ncbi:MAG: diadenylate cyclase CdaA [Lachnospiraceae bacterium]|nr:diadenylate cyclase CdaA [Lachnospiraceae bacterium]